MLFASAQTIVDCNVGPENIIFCYGSGVNEEYIFVSSDGSPLNLTVNSGNVENNFDLIQILDSDGSELYNGDGNDGDLSGLFFQSSGDSITLKVLPDGSISCQDSGNTGLTIDPIDLTVSCATCINPEMVFQLIDDCINAPQFFIEANVLDLGSATDLDITDNQGNPAQTVSTTGIVSFGPYPNGTTAVLTVSNNQDANCQVTSSSFTQDNCTTNLVDCTVGPINTNFCYDSNVLEEFTYVSSDGSSLNIIVNSGNVENSFDEFIVIDTDGSELYNGYGNDGDLSGLSFQSTGETITVQVTPDGSIDCQGSPNIDPIDLTVSCGIINTVTGKVLYDSVNNGCDSSDFGLSNYLINVNNGSEDFAHFVNEGGEYTIGLNSGNYTLSLLNLNSNFTSTPPTQNITFSGQDEILEDIDFCITANQQFEDLSIDIFPFQNPIPGFETDYQVIVSNNGTQTVPNLQVTFGYDESFQTYVSSTVLTSSTSTDSLDFELSNLEPFSQEVFEITLINVVPPTLNSGDVLSLSTSVTPDANDITPDDNFTVFNQTVVNSFDPNDKMVVQGDQIEIDDTDQYLDYRIRFQNLGTANALNVKITDTIDNNLDWTTFQPITSSHDYRIEIVDGEQINYYFDNINLPYEDADAEGSNGYITYKIKPKPTVQIGDTFENTAYIYFDFNLPIITNTVVTTVVDNLDAETFDLNRIKIYPNPVSDKLNIELPDNLNLNSIDLFDIKGKRLKSFKNQTDLDLSDMQKGIYILKLETDQGSFHHKVIKQ